MEKERTQLDVAIRRSVLTGLNQTAANLTELYAEDMDAEYYETTAHAGARPSHAEWQGRVLRFTDRLLIIRILRILQGTEPGAGLCGWNCRHSFYPYWLGYPVRHIQKETGRI